MKPVGVLGGMGPQASIEVYQRIIQKSLSLGAKANEDFPHLLISNLPVPSLIGCRTREAKAVSMVETEARRLVDAGCGAVVLACNTMHLFEERFQKSTDGNFFSLPDYVADRARTAGSKTIGVLGTPSTLASGLYAQPLTEAGMRVIEPNESDFHRLGNVIEQIIAGAKPSTFSDFLRRQVDNLGRRGADAVVLGCTELPLIPLSSENPSAPEDLPSVPIIDSVEELAAMTCFLYYSQAPSGASFPGCLHGQIPAYLGKNLSRRAVSCPSP